MFPYVPATFWNSHKCQILLYNIHYQGRSRRRWEDNIKMDLQEVGGGPGDWKELAQDRDGWRALVSKVKNLWVPQNAGNFLTSCEDWSASQEGLTVIFLTILIHGFFLIILIVIIT
jgi:hypothetical protein